MTTKNLIYTAIFSSLMAICAWITIPTATAPFTLQTFGVFLALLVLGGKKGLMAIFVYIGMGMVGLPVFSGFTGGFGVIFAQTGGYILGFISQGLVYIAFTKFFGEKFYIKIVALVIGLFVCYAFGTLWFVEIYSKNNSQIGFATALSWCVIPYIIPDLGKLLMAVSISKSLKKAINFD